MALSYEVSRVGLRVKHIKEVLKVKSSSIPRLVEDANTKLRAIFGMQLTVMPKLTKGAGEEQPVASTMKGIQVVADSILILQNILPSPYTEILAELAPVNKSSLYMGVVGLVVSIVAFSGGHIEAPVLMRHLNTLDLGSKLSSTSFQSIENMLKLMTRQFYLERTSTVSRADHSDEYVVYRLGRRSLREFSKEHLLKLCQTVMGDQFSETRSDEITGQFKYTGLVSEMQMPGFEPVSESVSEPSGISVESDESE